MKIKKTLSLLLVLTMLASLFYTVPAYAQEETEETITSYTINAYDYADSEKKVLSNAVITISTSNVVTNNTTVATSSNGTLTVSAETIAFTDENEAYYVSVDCEGYESATFTLTTDTMDVWFDKTGVNYTGLKKLINYYIGAADSSTGEPFNTGVNVTITANGEEAEGLTFSDGMAMTSLAEGKSYTVSLSAVGYKTASYTFTAGTADTATEGVTHGKLPQDAEEAGLTGYQILVSLKNEEAKEETHSHPVCGAECDGDCGVESGEHTDTEWIEVTQAMINNLEGQSLFSEDKNYYLAEDVSLSGIDGGGWGNAIMIELGVTSICLNGHTMTVPENSGFATIHIKAQDYEGYYPDGVYACLNVCDCVGGGELTIVPDDDDDDPSSAIWLEDSADMKIYGATISSSLNKPLVDSNYYYGLSVYNGGKVEHKLENGIALNYGNINLYDGSTVVGVIDGNINLSGKIDIDGHIETDSSITLSAEIEFSNPVDVYYYTTEWNDEAETYDKFPKAGDFTNSWGTNMNTATPTDYFANYSSSETLPAVNPNSGELYFIRGYAVELEYNKDAANIYTDSEIYAEGDTVNISYSLNNGYVFDTVVAKTASGNEIEVTKSQNSKTYTLTVPADDVSVAFTFKEENWYSITTNCDETNGWIWNDSSAPAGEIVEVSAYPNDGYTTAVKVYETADNAKVVNTFVSADGNPAFIMPAADVTVDVEFIQKQTGTIRLPGTFAGGTVTCDKTEAYEDDEITLTVTPEKHFELTKLWYTDNDNKENVIFEKTEAALLEEAASYKFTMPASDVTIGATFATVAMESPFTVKEVVDTAVTADKDTTRDGMHVIADDTVKVDVIVSGADYTNADWTLVYDYGKFAFEKYELNTTYAQTGVITHDETSVDNGVIIGYARGIAGNAEKADEFKNGAVVVSYYFKAIAQIKEVTGKFNITSAHANSYEMAGIQDNTAATSNSFDVTIILVTAEDDDDPTDEKTPAGTFEDSEKVYNALPQQGNAFVLDEDFSNATVTYAATETGAAVTDSDNDGSTTDEIAALKFSTVIPSFTNVGTYTYYAKVSGDGLATIYDDAVLKITPVTPAPSATFAVDPAVDKVTVTPILEGVIDGSHAGKVTVTYTDKDGASQTKEFEASSFKYDGESTSVGTAFDVQAQKNGNFEVKVVYTANENADNYASATGTASVNVDKLTAEEATVKALEDAITSEYLYDATAHKVTVADITNVAPGTWKLVSITDAYAGTADPTVTNVGEDKLAKVVFEDTTDNYNEVTIYVVLKVNSANVKITVNDNGKKKGEADPGPITTGKIEILDADGNAITQGLNAKGFYGEDDLGVEYVRDPGEDAGSYRITASYVPNDNYKVVEIVDGTFTIDAPVIDPTNPNSPVKVEIVDLSKGGTVTDATPDYIAGKRLVLVYTNLDKVYYGYGTADKYEPLYDVTAAGYKYVDIFYGNDTNTKASFTEDATEYAHVYGIVVDAIGTYAATEAYEKQYIDKLVFLGSDAKYAPENIVYDADINLSGELDVNDYSMNNGIYNVAYDRVSYMKSILKADYNHDKVINTTDALAVKAVADDAKTVNP